MTARRIAIILAGCGMVLGIGGTAVAAGVGITNAGTLEPVFLWTLLPLGLSAVVLVQIVRGGALWSVWAPIGTLSGFVVAAAWSLGLFYAYGAVVFLLAAVAHLAALRAWRQSLLACLWFIAGVTALGASLLLVGWVMEATTPGLTAARGPLIVWSSWICLGTLTMLGGWAIWRRVLSPT